jgi:hypothetical protein
MAYVGPETTLPIASSLAAFLGIGLIFWRRCVNAAKAFFVQFRRRRDDQ